jgi:hypothetical protein
MLSNYEARQLAELEKQLQVDSPTLCRRLNNFGRAWLRVRFGASVVGVAAGIWFVLAGIGWGAGLFGATIAVIAAWEGHRRLLQLKETATHTTPTTASPRES